MKASLLSRTTLISVLACGSVVAFGKDIAWKDLPGPAQREAQTELKNGPVKRVQSLKQNGQTIYDITFQRPDGTTKDIYLDANGTYVQNQNLSPATTPAAGGTPVQMSQLPAAVQNTIQTELKNGPVSQIEQLSNNGQVMYQVFFSKPNGKQKVIYLNPDGTYVKNGNAGVAATTPTHSWDRLTSSTTANTLVGARSVDFSSLPASVQNAFRTEAGASGIQNIQQGRFNGRTVYQADVNRNGQNLQVRVDSAGYIMSTAPLQSSFVNPQP